MSSFIKSINKHREAIDIAADVAEDFETLMIGASAEQKMNQEQQERLQQLKSFFSEFMQSDGMYMSQEAVSNKLISVLASEFGDSIGAEMLIDIATDIQDSYQLDMLEDMPLTMRLEGPVFRPS